MYILAIETTGKYGSAAIIDGDGKCVYASSANEMNHLSDVLLLVSKVLEEMGIKKEEITHVAASVGPGSFTGIRIGVATVRAISQTMNLPCVSVSSLEGLYYNSLIEGSDAKYICTIINARRNQTYCAIRKVKEGSTLQSLNDALKCDVVLKEKQYMIDEIISFIKDNTGDDKVLFFGDGADAYKEKIEEGLNEDKYLIASIDNRFQRADSVARAAYEKVKNGKTCTYEELEPSYLRKSEAEMRLENGTLSSKIGKIDG